MKKLTFKIFAAVIAMTLVLGTSMFWAQANDTKVVAIILKSLGDTKAKQKAGWAAVAKGSKLFSGDEVQTKKDGYAAVMFLDDKSVVKVKPNSVLKIQGTYEGKTISKQLVMDVGELFVKVSKQKGSFQVATPTSVASVKGTEFWVIESNGVTSVIGLEGLVELVNKATGQTINVGQGETGTSDKNGVKKEATKEIPDQGALKEEIRIKFKDANGAEKEVLIQY